jgi:acyl carrier protein
MSPEELLPRLKRLLIESLHLDGLDPDSIADDEPLFASRLGLDSVDALELVVALEREFGVVVPSEEIGGEAFVSVRTLADWLAPQLATSGGEAPR